MKPNPNDPDWIVELKERSAKMIVEEAEPVTDDVCSLLTKYDQMYNKIEQLREEIEGKNGWKQKFRKLKAEFDVAQADVEWLREQLQSAEAELKAQTYHGNSIGYIYDKMLCYKDQAGTMGEIMRTLGQSFDGLGNDNIKRRQNGLRWATRIAELIKAAEAERNDE